MTQKKTLLLTLSSFLCLSSAFTEEHSTVQEKTTIQIPDNHNRLYIGPSAAWYNVAYTNTQSQDAPTYGGLIGYDYLKNDCIYAGAWFDYLAGKLTGSFGNDFTQQLWTEGRIGYRIGLGQNKEISLTPFSGYGYLVLLQDIENYNDFRYRFMYVPLGFRATWQPLNFLELGINAMGGIPFSSKWKSGNSYTGNTRIISYIELPFRFFLTESKMFDVSVTPYWKNWSIRDYGNLIGEVNNIVGARIEFGFNL
jgi:hypothetical protein